MIRIENYNTTSSTYHLSKKILSCVKLSSNTKSSNREKLFIEDICKRVEKSKSVLYVLKDDENIIGLAAISATAIEDHPSIQIDYIFVNEIYRSKELEILDNTKPFRYLVDFIISIAKELQTKMGIRYIVLSPDTEDLKIKYKKVDFKSINKEWMFFKL